MAAALLPPGFLFRWEVVVPEIPLLPGAGKALLNLPETATLRLPAELSGRVPFELRIGWNRRGLGLWMRLDGKSTPLEHRASLASLYQRLSADPADPDLHAHINDLASRGDPGIDSWIETAAADLRWSIHLIETVFDPQTVILCGSAPEALVNRLIAAIGPLLPSIAERRGRTLPRLQPGMADPWSVALGAAAGPISRAFDPHFAAILKDSLQFRS